MGFEDIPEDRCQSFPCEHCEGGNVTEVRKGFWECDNCDYFYKTSEEVM